MTLGSWLDLPVPGSKRRKVPLAGKSEPQFLGFKRKPSGNVDTHSLALVSGPDWPDLNDPCAFELEGITWSGWRIWLGECESLGGYHYWPPDLCQSNSTYGGDSHPLTSAGARRTLFDLHQYQQKQHWTGLKLQGKLACLPSADHSVSHHFWRILHLVRTLLFSQ